MLYSSSQKILWLILFAMCGCQKRVSDYTQSILQQRELKKAEMLADERLLLKKEDEINKIEYFGIDPKYKIECDYVKNEKPKQIELSTYSGITKPYLEYAIASCKIDNTHTSFILYKSLKQLQMPGFANKLFLPFKDESNDETTYGGGRYLDLDESQEINGKIIIDFNKCYNPWCAYGDGFNCPIPPAQNFIKTQLNAGEKYDKMKWKQ